MVVYCTYCFLKYVQAIIKMKGDGSFFLKNLGKCSVSINSKEVAPGQSLSLDSNCLIEVLFLSFLHKCIMTTNIGHYNMLALVQQNLCSFLSLIWTMNIREVQVNMRCWDYINKIILTGSKW